MVGHAPTFRAWWFGNAIAITEPATHTAYSSSERKWYRHNNAAAAGAAAAAASELGGAGPELAKRAQSCIWRTMASCTPSLALPYPPLRQLALEAR